MVGERKFTGLGVNYLYCVKEGDVCPECVALITVRKEELVLGRYLGNPNVCDSRILGIVGNSFTETFSANLRDSTRTSSRTDRCASASRWSAARMRPTSSFAAVFC